MVDDWINGNETTHTCIRWNCIQVTTLDDRLHPIGRALKPLAATKYLLWGVQMMFSSEEIGAQKASENRPSGQGFPRILGKNPCI